MRTWWALGLMACAVVEGDDPVDTVHTDPEPPTAPPCLAPSWQVPWSSSDERATVALPDGANLGTAARFAGRPVVLDGEGQGTVEVTVTSGFHLVDERGVAVTTPLVLDQDELPRTLILVGDALGEGALSATPASECAADSVAIRAVPPVELAVRPLAQHPWIVAAPLWRTDEPVHVALDASIHPEREGLPYDVYIVPHRTPSAWEADPSLRDAGDGAETGSVGAGDRGLGLQVAWAQDLPPIDGLVASWDVVFDFGRDGRLDPGDLIDGLGPRPGFSTVPDLSVPGPFTPVRRRRDDGGFLAQEIWFPEELSGGAPLIVISHGNGHDFRWYGHLGEHLSSWGFVVMSHANNTGPGVRAASTTTLENVEHFLANHRTWFDGELAGRVDPTRMAWVGHSRGGEGVVRAYARVRDRQYAPTTFLAEHVRVVSSIAPTVFLGVGQSDPKDVPYHLLLGGADGDVTGGVDCDICQSPRLANAALGEVMVNLVHGASHNAFHNGDGFDDTVGPSPLPRRVVHEVELSYYLALAGWKLFGHDALRELFVAHPDVLRPLGVPDEVVMAQTWRDRPSAQVGVIDAFQVETATDLSDRGTRVRATVEDLVEGLLDDGNSDLLVGGRDPMNGMTAVSDDGFERGVVFSWEREAMLAFGLPAELRDLRRWGVLSLRACQSTRHPLNGTRGDPVDFSVEIVDGNGNLSRVSAAAFGSILAPYARGGLGDGVGWSNEFHTIRVPIAAFVMENPVIDLQSIAEVRLLFGGSYGTPTGRIGLDDLVLVRR